SGVPARRRRRGNRDEYVGGPRGAAEAPGHLDRWAQRGGPPGRLPPGPNAAYPSVGYRAELERTARSPGKVARNQGDAPAALAAATRRVEADYYIPHYAHAPMEPPAALAVFEHGRCEVWACPQHPEGAAHEIANALRLSRDDVTVHVTLLGGGFGRKSMPD